MSTKPVDESSKVLDELKKIQRFQLILQGISTCGILGLFIAAVISLNTVVPKAFETLSHIDSVVTQADQTLDDVNVMVSEMTEASKNLNKLMDDNAQDITDAVDKMAAIDFEGLNKAIDDLKNAVGPLATFFSRFR